jgi:hypothetical protein
MYECSKCLQYHVNRPQTWLYAKLCTECGQERRVVSIEISCRKSLYCVLANMDFVVKTVFSYLMKNSEKHGRHGRGLPSPLRMKPSQQWADISWELWAAIAHALHQPCKAWHGIGHVIKIPNSQYLRSCDWNSGVCTNEMDNVREI